MIEIMKTCIKEFENTIALYDLPKLQIGDTTIEAVKFVDYPYCLAWTEERQIYYRDELFETIDKAREYAVELMKSEPHYYFVQPRQ